MNKNPRISPESEAFQKLKGKYVDIWFMGEDPDNPFVCKLLGVDFFTLIIEPKFLPGKETILYKQAIQMIRASDAGDGA